MISYPKIAAADVVFKDFNNIGNITQALNALFNLPFNQLTPRVTAGATGVTVLENVFVAPTKCQVGTVSFVTDQVQAGAGNLPVVQLLNLTQASQIVAASAAIALAGAVGGVTSLVVDVTKNTVNAGDVLQLAIVNPAGTITTPLIGKAQFAWVSVV